MLDNQTLLLILLVLAFYLYSKKNTEKKEKKAEDFTETVESSVNDSLQEDFVLTKNTDAINSYPAAADLKDYAAEIVSSVDTQKRKTTESETDSSQSEPRNSLNRKTISRSGNRANDGFPKFGLLPRGTDPDQIPLKNNKPIPLEAMLPRQDGTNEWIARGSLVELKDGDILAANPRELFGIDTVSSSLKNASRDIRGTIPNPVLSAKDIGPWNHTSIDPDRNLVSLCDSKGGLFQDKVSRYIVKNSPLLSQ
jgi:hypothetical protein